MEQAKTVYYKKSRFVTQLPVRYRYSPSHAWIAETSEAGIWRVGLTRFATRMLGEIVDHGFEVAGGDAVEPGQIIGWIEGFKAISDLYCVASGYFVGGNPVLKEKIALVSKDCYGAGWLYSVKGEPAPHCIDVHQYIEILDKTIDKILEQQKNQNIE